MNPAAFGTMTSNRICSHGWSEDSRSLAGLGGPTAHRAANSDEMRACRTKEAQTCAKEGGCGGHSQSQARMVGVRSATEYRPQCCRLSAPPPRAPNRAPDGRSAPSCSAATPARAVRKPLASAAPGGHLSRRNVRHFPAEATGQAGSRHAQPPRRRRPLSAGAARPRADADRCRPEPGRGARHRPVHKEGGLHGPGLRRQQGAATGVPFRRGPRTGRRHGAGDRRGAVEPGAHRSRGGAQARHGDPYPDRGPGRGHGRDLPQLRQPAARPGAGRDPAPLPRGRGRGGGGRGDGAPRSRAGGRGPQALRDPLRARPSAARRARLRRGRRGDRGPDPRRRLRRRGLRVGEAASPMPVC